MATAFQAPGQQQNAIATWEHPPAGAGAAGAKYGRCERQASGASPCSEASSQSLEAMEVATPAVPAAAQQQLERSDSDSCGWFSKCRGCGCMTAHEQVIAGAEVPFCRRCQATLDGACPVMRGKMVDTLLYVHQAWSNAGL